MESTEPRVTMPTLPPRLRFPGLDSAAFEHPADRAALQALRSTPGLDKLLRWLSDVGAERYYRIRYMGDAIRVSPRQCSRLYNDLREVCAILDVKEPEFYLSQNPQPIAFTYGMQRHALIMTTGLVDLLNDTERLWVIGRELGHIKAEHMLYRTMAIILADILNDTLLELTIPGRIFSGALKLAFYAWFRRSEMTADRAGMLAVQEADLGIMALLKLVGGSQRLVDDLNPDEFVKQADLYEDMDEDMLSLYYKIQIISEQPFPFPALRAREMKEFAESEAYLRILRGDYPRADAAAGQRTCTNCGTLVTNVTFRFCPECGTELPPTA